MNLTAQVRRRRMLSAGLYVLVVLLALSVLADHLRAPRDDWTAFDHQTFKVTRVIDGDTIQIGNETTVRLIGIDAGEMRDPATNQPAYWSERARDYVIARAAEKNITLRLEPIQTRDRYGRLLAYVYLSDSDCLNLDLIHDGQAYADRRFRHAYKPQYEMAENEARRKQRGMWKTVTEDLMPAWRRVWLHARDQEMR